MVRFPFVIMALAILGAGAPTLNAQTGWEPSELPYDIPWPAGVGSGTIESAAVGQFSGEFREHALFIRGGVPVVMYEPTSFDYALPLPVSNAIAAATMPNEQWALGGTQDHMIIAQADRIKLWAFRPDLSFIGVNIDTSPDFQNARMIKVRDLNNDNLADLIILDHTGQQIRIKHQNTNGSFSTVPSPNLSYSQTLIDFEIGDFNAASGLEIASLSTTSLEFRDLNGVSLGIYPSDPSSQDSIDLIDNSPASTKFFGVQRALKASPPPISSSRSTTRPSLITMGPMRIS